MSEYVTQEQLAATVAAVNEALQKALAYADARDERLRRGVETTLDRVVSWTAECDQAVVAGINDALQRGIRAVLPEQREQAPPVVNVYVPEQAPTPVTLMVEQPTTVDVSLPARRTTTTVTRDNQGMVKETRSLEVDA